MEPVTKHLLGSNASHVPSCAAVVVEDIDKQLESELNKKLAYFEASNFQSADTEHAAYFGLDQPVRNLIDEIQARKVFEDAFPVMVEEETRNKKEIREQKENMVAASAVIPPPPGSQWQDMPKVAVNGALIANPAEMTAEKHRQFRHTWTMQERQRFKVIFCLGAILYKSSYA